MVLYKFDNVIINGVIISILSAIFIALSIYVFKKIKNIYNNIIAIDIRKKEFDELVLKFQKEAKTTKEEIEKMSENIKTIKELLQCLSKIKILQEVRYFTNKGAIPFSCLEDFINLVTRYEKLGFNGLLPNLVDNMKKLNIDYEDEHGNFNFKNNKKDGDI